MKPVRLRNADPKLHFTGLDAHVVEEEGAFTVRVRMLNNLEPGEQAWGEEIAATIDVAIGMIGSLASEFAIPQTSVSIKFVMLRYKDATFH